MLATETLYTPYNGAVLLENPLLNKGLAFTESERTAFNLQGLLPHNVETIEEQTERAWGQFCQFKKSISRHIYLRNIQDTNETLFYNLLRSHMKETLPIMLDVGTNNPQHLEDPLYMGWRHPRISDEQYLEFMDMFVHAIQQRWPTVLLQFEDFAQKNATRLLNRYRHQLCCFNDDIQGTAAVTSGTLIAAAAAAGTSLRDQRVVFLGGGSAGCGIAEKIIALMVDDGLSETEARRRIFMVDRFGLLTDEMPNLLNFQRELVTPRANIAHWDTEAAQLSLMDVVRNVHPTVLIGVSGQPGLFSEEIVKEMHRHCPRPIIMPLSNPTSRAEAQPKDLLEWTRGSALIATGSPFDPVFYNGKTYDIAQCNNAYIFPGLGLGILASKAERVTEAMLITCSKTLAAHSPLATRETGGLLPPVEEIEMISRAIAAEVARAAQLDGVAPQIDEAQLAANIDKTFWRARYTAYKRSSL